MALYEFVCDDCGPFEVERAMAHAGDPADCPRCARRAQRVFGAPRLSLLARPMRRALDREERSAHEPEVASAPAGRPLPHTHGHGHGH